MVIFATIFFKTVFLFVNFLSLLSAASSSARNSCGITSRHKRRRERIEHSVTYLNLSPLEELRILALRHEFLLRCGSDPNLNSGGQLSLRELSAIKRSRQHTLMPPSVKFTPRSSLDSRIHSTVDGVLKEYKLASRELQKIFTSFRLELELLDRLFYKNKNQHRGALFWRKVTEMRRFCHKLNRHTPDGLVEGVRRWFWGPLDRQK